MAIYYNKNDRSSVIVRTFLDGLTLTKSANKKVWLTDTLEYTLKLDNQTTKDVKDIVITDTLNTSLITFSEGTLKINGAFAIQSEYFYDINTGLLTIKMPLLTTKNTTIITWEVTKK